jgi:hypothetical protein
MSSRGIVYMASGARFIEEACQSAASVKEYMPNVPTTLFTHKNINHQALDNVRVEDGLSVAANAKRLKVECLRQTPYQQTIFLDTDTHVCSDVSELFDLLNTFDLAVAHAPNRLYFDEGAYPSDLPASFPEFNTGVLVYNSERDAVQSLLDAWRDRYLEMKQLGADRDQISFREVLYESNVSFTTLTPEYNCRFSFPLFLDGRAKILHARHSDLDFVEGLINHVSGRRTLQPWMFETRWRKRLSSFIQHVRSDLRSFLLPWRK